MSNIALGLYKYVDGVNDTPFPSSANQAFLVDWQYGARRMGGAPSITGGTINHTICLDNDWSMDVYVEYKGEKFFPSHKPTSSYSAQSITYEHKVDFYSERLVLDNVYFYDVVSSGDSGGKPVSNSTKFTFFGNITEFIARLNASMQRANTGYSAVLDPNQANADLEKQIKFDTKYISEALQEGFKAFGIPYYFVGKVCHYGDSQSSAIDNIVFEYGKDNSLMSIEKTNANTKIVNRITGVGSGDNIPYYYPNSCEQGVVDIANLSSSTITNLEIFDDMLFAKKVKRDAVLTYNMWSFNVDTPIFYLDGKPYTNGKGFSSDEIAQGQTLHVVVPFEVKYDGCTDLFMRFSVRPVATAISNLSLSPAISGVTPIADNGMVYVNALNKNIAKGKYQLAFDVNISTFSLILQVFQTEACTIYANGWKDNKDDNFYGDLEEIGIMMTGTASAGDNFKQIISKYIPPQSNLMPSIYRDSDGDERFYNATNNTYVNPDTGEYYEFPNPYANGKPKEFIKDYKDVKPTIAGAVNSASEPIDQIIKFAYDENDNDDLEEDGVTYKHPYFFALLHRTNGTYGFNLFDHTIDEGEMSLSFTSGRMGGCEFVIGVGEDSQKNLVQIALDGNLQPQLDEDGHPILVRDAETGDVICGREGQGKQIPQDWQNDTRRNEVWVALKKDSTTYGVIMPNATNNYRPSDDEVNEFVILHIDLPKAYILAAEQSIDNLLISYMAESNTEHWNFGIDFSRIYLKDTPNIANALDENKKIKIRYNGEIYSRYVLGYTYKTLIGEPLPSISIELAESLEGSTSALDTAINEINNMVEQQANAMIGYQQIARLARGALQTSNVEGAGSSTRPIYFDGHEAKVIDGLDVPESIRTQKNVEAMWGVSAFGIANMAISGTGGGGTVTAVSVNGNRYTPSNGLITLPDYPTAASLINDGLASRAWAYQNFAGKDYETRVQAIEALIPAQASSENQVADKAFVNSSVATATAEFQGTYDVVEDLGLTASATHAQIQTALLTAVASKQPDNNDYVFVSIPAVGSASGRYERYKFNGTSWAYEYTLNNSSFTAAQWAAITSGITDTKVSGYDTHLSRTDNPHSVTKAQVGLGNVENTALSTWVGTNNITTLGTITTGVWHGSAIGYDYLASAVQTSLGKADTALQSESDPVFTASAAYGITSANISAWNAKQNALAFDGTYDASTNKVATKSTVTNAINALDVSNITGFGAGKTLASLTETDGKIAATFQDISITKSQVSDFPTTWALADVTGADDLKAIEALIGTSGFLKKTAANTWALDTDVASGTALSDVSTRVGTLEGYFSNGKLNSANIDLATGDNNGQVKIAGTNVSVKGWNTAATHAHGDYVTAVGIDATNGKLKWYLGGVAQTAPDIVAARLVDTNKIMFGNTYWTSSGIPASIGTATAPAALDYVTNIDGLLYFDKTNRKVEVGTSAAPADIQSFGGVAALGIANMAINSGGGQGTLTQIKVNGTAIADVSGVVNITATTGNANGKIAIAGQQIPVYGLGTLAYASSLSFDNLSSHPTTLGGYGITDANIANGVITLGGNTIAPLTSITSALVTNALGYTPFDAANFTQSNIQTTLGVSNWALASSKPSYAFSEITGTASASQIPTLEISKINGLQTALNNKLETSLKGAANGLAELDANGLVPSSQLPSYVDDVLEYSSKSAFPSTGVSGKIYVALDTNLTYRWSGSAYVEISPSLALGETSSTAYRGDRGKTAYDHATETKSGAQNSGFYKFSVTAQGHISGVSAVAASDLTTLIGSTTYAPYNSAGYLPLSGGVISSSSNVSLTLNTPGTNSETDLVISIGGTNKAYFGYNKSIGAYMWNASRSKGLVYKDNGSLEFEGYTVWHSGNDGSGSGLDADLLDGNHASQFGYNYSSSNYDCNEVGTHFAAYRFSGSPTNAFPSSSYGNMLVIGGGSDTMTQIGAPYSAQELYFRAGTWYSNGTGSIRNATWQRIVHSGNISSFNAGSATTISKLFYKESEESTASGYYKIATLTHYNWGFCGFTILTSNSYSGDKFNTIFDCRCSDDNTTLNGFALNIIGGTDISSKLKYLTTTDANNNITKIEIFMRCSRYEHPEFYLIAVHKNSNLLTLNTTDWGATPDKASSTTMTGNAANTIVASALTTTSKGSSTQPVYFANGVPVACDLSTTYAPYNANGYLPLNGGRLLGRLEATTPAAGDTTISHSVDAIVVGPKSTRPTNANSYYAGIAFNHMLNYNNTTTYDATAQGWIGLRLYDTPGSERSYLVFATKNSTSNPTDRPEERMCISPAGYVGIGVTAPAYALDVSGDVRATNFRGALVGNADTATALTTVSKTAWGQTFWTSGGIPATISGDMSSVGNITPSADKTKDIGSESLQFSFVYASRFLTGSGAGMRYCATTGRHGWYNSYTTDSTTKQMELDANSNLTVQGDVMGMGGVSAMGIASMAINSMSGISFASQIAMNGQTYNATSGLITLPNFTDAYNPSGTGSTTQALSQKGAKALYTTLNNAIPATATIAGWGYKKGMVYTTSTASSSSIDVATGADPTYQFVTNTSQSSLIITVTTSGAASNSYGVHRYIMIYNNRSSATLVQFADQGQGVVGPADSVSIPAYSYMEFSIIHPASNAKCMVTWSMPLKDITTM